MDYIVANQMGLVFLISSLLLFFFWYHCPMELFFDSEEGSGGARLMMIVKFVCFIRIPGVYQLLRVRDYRLCLRNLLVLAMVAPLTFLLTDQGLVHRFGC